MPTLCTIHGWLVARGLYDLTCIVTPLTGTALLLPGTRTLVRGPLLLLVLIQKCSSQDKRLPAESTKAKPRQSIALSSLSFVSSTRRSPLSSPLKRQASYQPLYRRRTNNLTASNLSSSSSLSPCSLSWSLFTLVLSLPSTTTTATTSGSEIC